MIVHTQIQDVAVNICLLVLIMMAANKTKKDNDVPK